MENEALIEELTEFRLRLDASELRQASIESRQARIERLLGDQEKGRQATNKLLMSLNERVDKLIESVFNLAAKS